MSEKIKVILRKQEDLFDRVKRMQINYKKSPRDRVTATYIETKLEALEKLYEAFFDGHSELAANIERSDKTKLAYFEDDVYSQFEEVYVEYKTKLKDDLHVCRPNQDSTYRSSINPTDNIGVSGCEVKLPQIHLPKFCGGYEEWQTFHDMFDSLIHKNISLSAVQKLHYLKNCLSGEAENLLKNLSTTENNYSEAWRQLTRRYSNKRYNSNEIMKRLFGQKSITSSQSATAIKQLLDTTSSCLTSLENFNINTSSWDVIINYLTVSKLDLESRKLWELEVNRLEPEDSADYLPSWAELKKFLETRFRTLEMLEPSYNTTTNKLNSKQLSYTSENTAKPIAKQRSFHASLEKRKPNICPMCLGEHALYQCKKFENQTPEKRTEYIQAKGLCFNCLSPTHIVKKCQVPACCRCCGKRHHTLLHYERPSNQGSNGSGSSENASTEAIESNVSNQRETRVVAHFAKESQQSRVLLATAMVKIKSSNDQTQIVRALIDQGSESSFITKATAKALQLKGIEVNGVVSGIGNGETRTKSKVSFVIESISNPEFSVPVDAFVLRKLTCFLPSRETSIHDWPEINQLPLADPNYGTPGKIDVILGVEVYGAIILEGLIRHTTLKGPVAQNTQLGWILSGRFGREVTPNRKVISLHLQTKEEEIFKIEREPESIGEKIMREELLCGKIYQETMNRDEAQRYVIRLFIKELELECLCDQSSEIVMKFKSREKISTKHTNNIKNYKMVIEEYNHVREGTERDKLNDPCIVYRPEMRKNKEKSKPREVFNDLSSLGKVSLNGDLLLI